MNKTLLCLLALAPLSIYESRADIKMPAIFGDHMVLQQEKTVPVWGWAAAGEKVTVIFGDPKEHHTAEATTGPDGKWRADLTALPGGTAPGVLTIVGKNTITIQDVLVGDVWLCSGQSNMEFGTNKAQTVDATDDQIRLFHVPHQLAIGPREDVTAKWQVCTPETLPGFTAVGYFFGKDLRAALKRPIGLIESSWGGTPAQSWTSIPALQADPALTHYADSYKAITDKYPGGDDEFAAKSAEADAAFAKWNTALMADTAYQDALKAWHAAADQAKAAKQTPPPQPTPPAPRPPGVAGGAGTPSMLFDGMINPLIPYAIKGVIWYQGESNASNAMEYRTLFPAMITDWRARWKTADLPFLFVQLANFMAAPKTAGENSAWAILRESQVKTLALPKTGMAVILDIGTGGNIHPPDKKDVGSRLALAARHVAYGEKLVYTGPMFDALKVEGGKARISFKPDSIGGGLVIGSAPWTDPLAAPVSKTDLQGFAIAGEDKNWVWADAKIDGNDVVVSSPDVPQPVAVRYAFANNPACNLYNKEGLPASPFRTDDWQSSAPAKAPAVPSATPVPVK
ncbi:MAG: sialate O-acetylesterase [Chthoniobacteraceae bacterium]